MVFTDRRAFTAKLLGRDPTFDDFAVTKENIETILNWKPVRSDKDIPFKPARVLMQEFTGVPAVVDIASLLQHQC